MEQPIYEYDEEMLAEIAEEPEKHIDKIDWRFTLKDSTNVTNF
jgi:hypothetical protein